LLEIGLIADMIDNGQDGGNANANNGGGGGANGQNHLIDANEDAAFREFMQMMTN